MAFFRKPRETILTAAGIAVALAAVILLAPLGPVTDARAAGVTVIGTNYLHDYNLTGASTLVNEVFGGQSTHGTPLILVNDSYYVHHGGATYLFVEWLKASGVNAVYIGFVENSSNYGVTVRDLIYQANWPAAGDYISVLLGTYYAGSGNTLPVGVGDAISTTFVSSWSSQANSLVNAMSTMSLNYSGSHNASIVGWGTELTAIGSTLNTMIPLMPSNVSTLSVSFTFNPDQSVASPGGGAAVYRALTQSVSSCASATDVSKVSLAVHRASWWNPWSWVECAAALVALSAVIAAIISIVVYYPWLWIYVWQFMLGLLLAASNAVDANC